MNDKELLEFAAKSVDYEFVAYHILKQDRNSALSTTWAEAWAEVKKPEASLGNCRWNPLLNDADSFKLAVQLNFAIVQDCEYSLVEVHYSHSSDLDRLWLEEDWAADKYSATRRAIVRAAAEIGKSK